jgi:cell division protein FtsB
MRPLTFSKLSSGIALGAAALLAVGCGKKQDPTVWWQGEQERIELSQQIELKKFRFEQLDSADFAELDGIHRHSSAVDSKIASLRTQSNELQAQINSLKAKWEDYKGVALEEQRRKALGKSFETLRLSSGREFENVSVASIDDSGVTIHHTYGSARLRYADLDSRQRMFFGLDEDLALAAQKKESEDAVAYERWVHDQSKIAAIAAVAKNEKQNAASARLREISDQKRRSDALADQIYASNTRTLAQPSKSVGGVYSRSYSNYRSYSPSYRYVYYGASNCYNNYGANRIVTYPTWFPNKRVGPTTQSFSNTTIPSIP